MAGYQMSASSGGATGSGSKGGNLMRGMSNFSAGFAQSASQMGGGRAQSRIFSKSAATGAGSSVVDEEKSDIAKIFSIVDQDNSGQIDTTELLGMFTLYGVEVSTMKNTIDRIMQNVDKDYDNCISQAEFYELLSQKFKKGDPRKDIDAVFKKMDKKNDQVLDMEEMHEISQLLGENIPKTEIKEMIKMFSQKYQADLKSYNAKRGEKGAPPAEPSGLTPDDFYQIMQTEFEVPVTDEYA
eukprot:TRINITY_DN63175_c0_g1_i1.p1 TRINITY_DN63175_c0_g1~~TRINITY_DN63175_c0_g1_i1.p1  ORF type:complete len:265 (-),score=70.64 TRINITY_DN63175_c0_g1_i1:81-800(-)